MKSGSEISVGDLVVERPARARVFEKLGIDYCCGGKRALADVCREKNLDLAAVTRQLENIDVDSAAPSSGDRNWNSASLTDLCDHIEQTHHAFAKEELPRLDFLTKKVAARHGETRPALLKVRELFSALKAETESHMLKEERILFPFCRKLDVADELPASPFGTVASPIEMMVQEHEDAGDALAEMRALTEDYSPPADACNTFRAMYDGLQAFERDMHRHVHKENHILFPKAMRQEKLLNAKS